MDTIQPLAKFEVEETLCNFQFLSFSAHQKTEASRQIVKNFRWYVSRKKKNVHLDIEGCKSTGNYGRNTVWRWSEVNTISIFWLFSPNWISMRDKNSVKGSTGTLLQYKQCWLVLRAVFLAKEFMPKNEFGHRGKGKLVQLFQISATARFRFPEKFIKICLEILLKP